MTKGFRSLQDIAQKTLPKNAAMWETAITKLTLDYERERLTLKGPALAYYMLYADLHDPMRAWVMQQLDVRIAASVERRLGGATVTDRHVCPACLGKGEDHEKEQCDTCVGIGLVCPICTGSRWVTDGRPTRHTDQAFVAACPGCMTAGKYDHAKAQRTIQNHINHPYVPTMNVSNQDMADAYARAEANAIAKRNSPPEPSALGSGRRGRRKKSNA